MRAWRNVDSVSGGENLQDEPGTSYYTRKPGNYQTLNRLVKRTQKPTQTGFH